jgi:choline dehydrogenase-like flavoprotein
MRSKASQVSGYGVNRDPGRYCFFILNWFSDPSGKSFDETVMDIPSTSTEIRAAGAQKRWRLPITESDGSTHLLGTCRMGNDPNKSVINPDHRSHEVPNLFICDGSSLMTSGRNQPTETIQALAFRAADRITMLAKSGQI